METKGKTAKRVYKYNPEDPRGKPLTNFQKANISPEELQIKIEHYFKHPDRKHIVKSITTKGEKMVKVYTLPGLALYLGFDSREGYRKAMNNSNNIHSSVLKKAYTALQNHLEENVFVNNSVGGMFILKNMEYSDNTTVNQTVTETKKPEIITSDKETGKEIRRLIPTKPTSKQAGT